ncbi:MAG: energy transducer TonB [Bacteroidetes bacterium]|nr:energy transducer TonB [Bacteroidota bacterium]MBL7105272.1 energy transducer TonB [Bacteroidales bacterium]
MKIKKSKKANLEKKREIYFQIGVVISLSLVLLAFEWTTVESGKIDLKFNRDILIEDDLSEITIHKKKPEMPKPKIVQIIDIVDDETEIDDEIFEIDAEVTEDTKNDINIQPEFEYEEEVDETAIFKVVEKMPEFPGGVRAMHEFLSSHIKYPYDAKEIGIIGIV